MKVEVWLGHPGATALARGLLAVLFLAASVGKIRDPCGFASAVVAYRLLPRRWVRPFAYTLPRVEVILGLMLVLGWKTRIVAALCGLLLFSFTLAMGINLARGRTDLDCGCFGERHRRKIGGQTLVRDVVLMLLSLQLVLWGGGYLALDNLSPQLQEFVLGMILPLILAGCGLYMVVRLIKQLLRLLMLVPVEQE